jgi:hypothetical protein
MTTRDSVTKAALMTTGAMTIMLYALLWMAAGG